MHSQPDTAVAAGRSGCGHGRTRRVPLALGWVALVGLTAGLCGPAVSWPWVWDDLHLVREYSWEELRGVLWGPWDPDGIESPGYRPGTTWFNHARYWLCGESVVAHRVLLWGLYASFLVLLVAALERCGLPREAGLLGAAMSVASRYSVYHYVWLTDGVHLVQGLCVAAALWAFVRTTRGLWWTCLALGCVALGLLVREDTLAGIGVVCVTVSWWVWRRRRGWLSLALLVVGTFGLSMGMWAVRESVVPDALSPGMDVAGWLSAIVRGLCPAGVELPAGPWGWLVLGTVAGAALVVTTLITRGGWAPWLILVPIGALPGLTMRRGNLLLFSVTAGGLVWGYGLWRLYVAGGWRRHLAVVAGAVAFAGSAMSSRATAAHFHPCSASAVEWNAQFIYGTAASRAKIPPKRWRRTARQLAVMGIRSAEDLGLLDVGRETALRLGRRSPEEDLLFMPQLGVW